MASRSRNRCIRPASRSNPHKGKPRHPDTRDTRQREAQTAKVWVPRGLVEGVGVPEAEEPHETGQQSSGFKVSGQPLPRTLDLPTEPTAGPFGLDFAIAPRYRSLYQVVTSKFRKRPPLRRRIAVLRPTSGFPLLAVACPEAKPSGWDIRPFLGLEHTTINHTGTVLLEFDRV